MVLNLTDLEEMIWEMNLAKEETETVNFQMFKLVLEKAEEPEKGALPPPCIVRKDPRVPHTARRGAWDPLRNSKENAWKDLEAGFSLGGKEAYTQPEYWSSREEKTILICFLLIFILSEP